MWIPRHCLQAFDTPSSYYYGLEEVNLTCLAPPKRAEDSSSSGGPPSTAPCLLLKPSPRNILLLLAVGSSMSRSWSSIAPVEPMSALSAFSWEAKVGSVVVAADVVPVSAASGASFLVAAPPCVDSVTNACKAQPVNCRLGCTRCVFVFTGTITGQGWVESNALNVAKWTGSLYPHIEAWVTQQEEQSSRNCFSS